MIIRTLSVLFLVGFLTLASAEACKKGTSCSSKVKSEECHKKSDKEQGTCKGNRKTECKSEKKENCHDGHKEAHKSDVKGKPQTLCPVMDSPINKDLSVVAKGKRIYICCAGCGTKIKSNPDKFIKKLEDAGVQLENLPH